MHDAVLSVFERFVACSSYDESTEFLLKYPVLFSPSHWSDFETEGARLALSETSLRGAHEMMKRVLSAIDSADEALSSRCRPIENIWADTILGKITESHALSWAADPAISSVLSPIAVYVEGRMAERGLRDHWRAAYIRQKLVLSALDARRLQAEENQLLMDGIAVIYWLDITARALYNLPDRLLLLDAVERGEALAKRQHPFVPFPPGEIYHRLGVLHLDPYVAGRASASYQQQMQLWQSRLYEEYGLALSADAITQRKLPDPQDALHKSVTYLETAASLRSGEPRGRTLKAMVQALHWIETLGGKSDIGVLTEAAREARSLLSEDCYPVEFYELTLLLDFHTKSFGEAAKKEMDLRARRLLETPASVWTKRLGKTETYDRFLMTAEAIRHSNPELALQVWRAAKPVLTEEDEDLKNSYYVAGTYFVRDALARKAPDPSGKPITDLIHTINVTAKKRNWSTQVVAACLFWIAASSASRNQEHQGLIALDLCLRKDKSFARKFSDLIAWTRATLELGAAVNAYNQDRFEEASTFYATAVGSFLATLQPRSARHTIARIVDIARSRAVHDVGTLMRVLQILIDCLEENSLLLEQQAGDTASEFIQQICRRTLALIAGLAPLRASTLFSILHVAKGRRFAAALSQDGPLEYLKQPAVLEWERQIGELARATVTRQSDIAASSELDGDTLLVGYVTPFEKKGGATSADQLRNSQIHFDTELNRQIAKRGLGDAWSPSLPLIQRSLDERTVLAIQYLGTAPNAAFSLITALVSRDDFAIVGRSAPFSDDAAEFTDAEQTVALSPIGVAVKALRTSLRKPPGPRAANSEALRCLKKIETTTSAWALT
jgi:hypothetical protein